MQAMILWSAWGWGAAIGGFLVLIGLPAVFIRALWQHHDELGHILLLSAESAAINMKMMGQLKLDEQQLKLEQTKQRGQLAIEDAKKPVKKGVL